MPFCPNCSAQLESQALSECWNCHATFGAGSAWVPVAVAPSEFRLFPQPKRPVQAVAPSPGPVSAFSVLGNVVARAIVAALASGASVVLALLDGFFSGGGRGGLVLASAVVFAVGWVVLPAVRASRVVAVLCAVGWVSLAVWAAMFGASSVRGWLLAPWVLATVGLSACLLANPPEYAQSAINAWKGGGSSARDA
jgi:hypothetical protein